MLRLSFLLFAFAASASIAVAEKSWSLLHSFDGKTFVPRGQVKLALSDENEPEITLENDDSNLGASSVDSMVQFGLYQLKLVEDGSSNYVVASVPACQLKRANFRDEIEILLNEQGSAVSLTYTPLVSKLAPSCEEMNIPDELKFTSKIQYETATPAMTIPKVLPPSQPQLGLTFFPRSQGGQAMPGAKQDQPAMGGPMGFLMRYWYIALPLFIMGLIGPAEEEPQQQRGGQASAAAAAAGAATVSSGGSSGGGRRRGKRG